MADILTFNVTNFRLQFPAYSNVSQYPDITLQGYWDMAIQYISDVNWGSLKDAGRQLAINYMTAHLAYIAGLIATGNTSVLVSSATVDKVTVSMTPPPLKNQWQWWLSTSPYGQQLLALLAARSVGGFYVGGLPESIAFRKVGGIF